MCVCVFAKLDQFLPVRSHFDTKRAVDFFHIATFPSPTFRPLPIVFMVLGVSYLRVLAQRPTGCCSASYYYFRMFILPDG